MTPHSPPKLAVALVACALYLTVGDLFHVHFGVITEEGMTLLSRQAWWVPVGFALAVVGFVALAWPFTRSFPEVRPRDLAIEGAWFLGSYAASGVFGAHVWLLTIVFTVLWLARVVRRTTRRPLIVFSLVLAACGTIGEIALHATGVCRYAYREIVLVPLWLPALYLQGAPMALAVAKWVRGEPQLVR